MVLFRERQRSLSSLSPPGSSVWWRKGLNYTLSLWSAREKMSLPSEERVVPRARAASAGLRNRRQKKSDLTLRRTEMARPREALKGTNCGSGSKGPRSSAHSVLTPGLERYFVWTRLRLWGLTVSLKRPWVLGHTPSNQFSLLHPFLCGHVVHRKMAESYKSSPPTVVM